MQRSVFYRFSLEKRGNALDSDKFLTDPWFGNSAIGRDILDGIIGNSGIRSDLTEIFSTDENDEYTHNFSWIRNLQAVGGNSSMRLTRDLILMFISNYRKTKSFWLSNSWSMEVSGERIINWMFSYSFYASGSNDAFQKAILSSMTEQFSHLWKSYRAESNMYSRLIALKAILAYLCAMKNIPHSKVRKIIKEIGLAVEDLLDTAGMALSRNPIEHFNIFKSLIETRFIAKNLGIALPKHVFSDNLAKMAACIRFLRLGDGGISGHIGWGKSPSTGLIPGRQMIDTALSVVEFKANLAVTIPGFTRLSSKKIILIVNTLPCYVRSHFTPPTSPGLNIFDFEASFGLNRLINRADISILINGICIKITSKANYFSKIQHGRGELHFIGEIQQTSRHFGLRIQREFIIDLNKEKIKGRDTISTSDNCQTFPRFVFDQKAIIKEIHSRSVLITVGNAEYIFSVFQRTQNCELFIIKDAENTYPTIEIGHSRNNGNDTIIEWIIELNL
jgi:uncharacterized heparinase superfamily protein